MIKRDVAGTKRIWAAMRKMWLPAGLAIFANLLLTDSVFAHDCSTEADCLQTAGYLIASAIAASGMGVVAGLLGSNMATGLQGGVEDRIRSDLTRSVEPTKPSAGTQIEPTGLKEPPPREQVIEIPEGVPQIKPSMETESDLPPGHDEPAGDLASLPADADGGGADRSTILDMLRDTKGGNVLMDNVPVFGYPGMAVVGSPPVTAATTPSGGGVTVEPYGPVVTTGLPEPPGGSEAAEQLPIDESTVSDELKPLDNREGNGGEEKPETNGTGEETEHTDSVEETKPPEETTPPEDKKVRWSIGDVVLEEVVGPDGKTKVVVVDRASWYDGTTTVNIDYNLDTGDPLSGSASGQGDKFKWNASETDKDEFNFKLNRIDPNRPGVGSLEFHGGGGQETSGNIKGRYGDAEWSAEQTPDDKFNAQWNRLNQQDPGVRHGEVHAGGGQDFSGNISGGYSDANWKLTYDQNKLDGEWRRINQNDPGLRYGDIHAGGGQDFSGQLQGGYREANWNLNYNQDKLDANWTRLNQNDAGVRSGQLHAGGGQDFSMNLQGGSRGLNWQANFSEKEGFSADLSSTNKNAFVQRMELGSDPELDLRLIHDRNITLDANLREGGSGATLTHRPSGLTVSYGKDGLVGPLDNLRTPDMPGPTESMSGSDETFTLGRTVRF